MNEILFVLLSENSSNNIQQQIVSHSSNALRRLFTTFLVVICQALSTLLLCKNEKLCTQLSEGHGSGKGVWILVFLRRKTATEQ